MPNGLEVDLSCTDRYLRDIAGPWSIIYTFNRSEKKKASDHAYLIFQPSNSVIEKSGRPTDSTVDAHPEFAVSVLVAVRKPKSVHPNSGYRRVFAIFCETTASV